MPTRWMSVGSSPTTASSPSRSMAVMPFPAGLTTSSSTYQVQSKSSPILYSPRSSSLSSYPKRCFRRLTSCCSWVRTRPLVALLVLAMILVVASGFLPFLLMTSLQNSTRQQTQTAASTNTIISSDPLAIISSPSPSPAASTHPSTLSPSQGIGIGVGPPPGPDMDALAHRIQSALGISSSDNHHGQIAKLAQHQKLYQLQTAAREASAKRQQQQQQQPLQDGKPADAALADDAQSANPSSPSPIPPPSALPLDPLTPTAQPDRQSAIIQALKIAFGSYERHCMGHDDYHPVKKRCTNWIHAGLTLIDALPTMMLMGEDLASEVSRARQWLASEQLNFGKSSGMISFFETTIRVLGGLIAAYDLTDGQDEMYLQRAQQLGERLLPAFGTPTGLPRGQISLASGSAMDVQWTGGSALLAEVATFQLEFAALGQRLAAAAKAGRPIHSQKDHSIDDGSRYTNVVNRAMDTLERIQPRDGLYPLYLSTSNGAFKNSKISFGAMGDSAYEYFLKLWLIRGRGDERAKSMYLKSMTGMMERLVQRAPRDPTLVAQDGIKEHVYIADINNGKIDAKMDHLVCFLPGLLALGVEEGVVEGEEAEKHMNLAKEVMRTCYESYVLQATKIGPEFMVFRPTLKPGHNAYKLRPEMIESLFLLYRVTRDPMYREWGWNTFQAIEQHCRLPNGNGYAALLNVAQLPVRHEDMMESFFLAETLKYLYLLFSEEDKLPIAGKRKAGTYFVFNTEAQPIRSWE